MSVESEITTVQHLLLYLLQIAWWIVLIHVVMSWLIAFNILNISSPVVYRFWAWLNRIMQPIYRPIQRFMPDLGGLDISPIIILVAIQLLRGLVPRMPF